MTNREKINQMSTEELSEFINEMTDCIWCPIKMQFCDIHKSSQKITCKEVIKKWLESEVE